MGAYLSSISLAILTVGILVAIGALCAAGHSPGRREGFAPRGPGDPAANNAEAHNAEAHNAEAHNAEAHDAEAHNAEAHDAVEHGPGSSIDESCRAGPPASVSGNCRPLCKGQTLQWKDGIASSESLVNCKEADRSDEFMLCRSHDDCDDGPWYKTTISPSDKSAQSRREPQGGVSPEPSTIPPGDIDVPGRSARDSWKGDQTYPSDSTFHGGTHHHYYDGSENRKWRQEVIPASPHLSTSQHGRGTLGRHMSPAPNQHGSGCKPSITGEFSDCGPAAANVPCYELFN